MFLHGDEQRSAGGRAVMGLGAARALARTARRQAKGHDADAGGPYVVDAALATLRPLVAVGPVKHRRHRLSDEPGHQEAGGVTPLQLAVASVWRRARNCCSSWVPTSRAGHAPCRRGCAGIGAVGVDMLGYAAAQLTPLMVAAAAGTLIGVFGRDRSFALLDSAAVDWKGRSARRHAPSSRCAIEQAVQLRS